MAYSRMNFLLLGMSSRLTVDRLFHSVLRIVQPFVRCGKIRENFVYMQARCSSLDRMRTDLVNVICSISVHYRMCSYVCNKQMHIGKMFHHILLFIEMFRLLLQLSSGCHTSTKTIYKQLHRRPN